MKKRFIWINVTIGKKKTMATVDLKQQIFHESLKYEVIKAACNNEAWILNMTVICIKYNWSKLKLKPHSNFSGLILHPRVFLVLKVFFSALLEASSTMDRKPWGTWGVQASTLEPREPAPLNKLANYYYLVVTAVGYLAKYENWNYISWFFKPICCIFFSFIERTSRSSKPSVFLKTSMTWLKVTSERCLCIFFTVYVYDRWW